MNGNLAVFWGDAGEEGVILDPLDTISVPQGVMRGFRNPNDHELIILAMVGATDGGGPVTWHREILERAKTTGLAVEDGKLKRLDNFRMPEGLEEIEVGRSEEHTSELQSLMRISYAVFCLTTKKTKKRANR